MADISILIPVRLSSEQRKRIYDFVIPKWKALDVDLCIGVHDGPGPFNNSAACNKARAKAKTKRLAVFTLDSVPPTQKEIDKLALHLSAHPWSGIYSRTKYLNEQQTKEIMSGKTLTIVEPFVHKCVGLIGYQAATWDDLGGYPEAFVGWGCEDSAMRRAVTCLYGKSPKTPLDYTLQLWHPNAPRDRVSKNMKMLNQFSRALSDGNEKRMREILKATREPRDK